MKVVVLSIDDKFGAGRAAARINRAVNFAGTDSQLYVYQKPNYPDSNILKRTSFEKIIKKFCYILNCLRLLKYPHRSFYHAEKYGINFKKCQPLKDADIIHLHWINDGIWSPAFINYLIKLEKPIVWTMHDMWPFTGGCHYDDFCGKYSNECGCCPALNSQKNHDLSYKEIVSKKILYGRANICFVGCSEWMTNIYRESTIAKKTGHKAFTIPNPIDTEIFHKMDKAGCRKKLKLPVDKKIILFGAVNSTTDRRKGYKMLKDAISHLNHKSEYVLVVFGCEKFDDAFSDIQTFCMGIIKNDKELAILYNAADVFVAPSIQENLANTVVESIACGTPVAAFNIGGMKDMIISGFNGYLAKPYDTMQLSNGIKVCLADCGQTEEHIKFVHDRFSYQVVGNKYTSLYRELLENRRNI